MNCYTSNIKEYRKPCNKAQAQMPAMKAQNGRRSYPLSIDMYLSVQVTECERKR